MKNICQQAFQEPIFGRSFSFGAKFNNIFRFKKRKNAGFQSFDFESKKNEKTVDFFDFYGGCFSKKLSATLHFLESKKNTPEFFKKLLNVL